MRRKLDFCADWYFLKRHGDASAVLADGEAVTLPHTWNAEDGQDGGNDYYRGRCWYVKKFPRPDLEPGQEAWLEFEAGAMITEVFLNGEKLTRHEGGYSTFRVDITQTLAEENLLAVSVDNGKNDYVYPQKADFTFYGGLYRKVWLLIVSAAHFALNDHSGPGIQITPRVAGGHAEVTVEAWTEGPAQRVRFTVDGSSLESGVSGGYAKAVFRIERVHLWDGTRDPYLYLAKAELESGDIVEAHFGCRNFSVNPEQGFLLNGRPYRLCGAARHQDRQGVGSALTRVMHDEDMALLREMGANTIRLAHYQHDQYFYDLCDQYGMIVWAEIPYITEHMPTGRDNTIDQMTELIEQNYNHPSIVCWGLSNEITATGGVNADMVENHRLLNEMCHELDPTRLTTMAHVFMLDSDDPFVMLPDIRSYNLYYGWYVGGMEENDVWFDTFHAKHPDAIIGLSEYGADANPSYQNGNPKQGDWSEPYQALYHEHMLQMWSERPYIWAMHCWNMFDFGADGRNEGGKPGQNQKGLVTFDRKIKKDAFYIYKAYLSDEPFVHLCGRRYVDRAENCTEIKVYSNQRSVTLYVDGKEFDTCIKDKIFKFCVPISGEHIIVARSGSLSDTIRIRSSERSNPDYIKEGEAVINWFERPEEIMREGYYSVLDSLAELKADLRAASLLEEIMAQAKAAYGDVAQNVTIPKSLQRQMDAMPLEYLLRQAGRSITPETVKVLNHALNQIKKP